MTAAEQAPDPRRPAPASRPHLSVITNCEHCGQRITEVRSRDGKPVRLLCGDDGKALRDPDGDWWAAKMSGRWCVVQLQPGEDPPTSGQGVRYSEHRCVTATAEAEIRTRFGIAEPEPVGLVVIHDYEPGVVRRPPGRGQGLSGPECPERSRLVQANPGGGPPFQRMCLRCGRVTARSDGDGLPWCGGGLVQPGC